MFSTRCMSSTMPASSADAGPMRLPMRLTFRNPINPLSAPHRFWAAPWAGRIRKLFERTTRRLGQNLLSGWMETKLDSGTVSCISKRIVWSRPFCKSGFIFRRSATCGKPNKPDPKNSGWWRADDQGHYATLLSRPVETLLP